MDKLMQPVALLVQACSAHGGFPPDDKRIHATVTDGTQRLATFCQHLQGCPAFIGAHLPRLWDFVASVISLAQQEEAIVESSLKVIMYAPLATLHVTCYAWCCQNRTFDSCVKSTFVML